MPLTPEDVQNKRFSTVRFKEGYDEEEVDAFLDEVEAELRRLLGENSDLRSHPAAAAPAAASVAAAPAAPVQPAAAADCWAADLCAADLCAADFRAATGGHGTTGHAVIRRPGTGAAAG